MARHHPCAQPGAELGENLQQNGSPVHSTNVPHWSSVDRAFARYQRTGHPAWLAAVFDATAAELLQLAAFLSGDRQAAEDLVQATFLAAIEQRLTYDSSQPVLPWLCGILANRARAMRRSRAIASRHAKRLPHRDDIHDAAAEASAAELRTDVLTALRSLPEPYRQVLLLHLQHDLDGREIGDALQRPAATVRSQIHRGLAMLRKALPIGLAGTASAMAAPPTTAELARVRAAVLTSPNPTTWLPWVLAFATMHKPAFALVAVAALTLLGLVVWPIATPPEDRAPTPRTPAEVASLVAPAEGRDADLPPPDAERIAADGALTTLAITVLQKNGEPLADVGVVWTLLLDRGTLAARDVRTDSAGRARFVDLPAGRCIVRSDRGGYVQVDVSVGGAHEATLQVPGERTVHGVVVDEHDRPVAAAEVWLLSHFQGGARLSTTAADGTFTAKALPTDHLLAAWAPGRSTAHPQWLTDQRPEPWSCRLVVSPCGGDLSGTVRDPRGQPVPGATVLVDTPRSAEFEGREWAQGACDRQQKTDEHGRFCFLGVARGTRQLWCASPDFAATSLQVAHGDAPTDVTVTLSTGATVRGTVRREDGRPAADAWVQQVGRVRRPTRDPDWSRGQTNVAADGTFVLARLTPGVVALQASRQDARRCTIELTLAEGELAEWNPRFGEQQRIHGIVVDPAGSPLVGYRVRVQDDENSPPDAITDSIGAFNIDVTGPAVQMNVLSPRQDRVVWQQRNVPPGDEPLRIVIPAHQFATATLVGTLLAADGSAIPEGSVELQWLRDDGGIENGGAAVVRDGRFQATPLRPGRYHLAARARSFGTLHAGPFPLAHDETLDIGTLCFATAGRLRVKVAPSDAPAPTGRIMLLLRAAEAPTYLGHASSDGSVDFGLLQPGVYFVTTWGELPATTVRVELHAGETLEHTLAIPASVRCLVRYPAIPCDRHVLRHTWRDERGEVAFDFSGSNDEGEGFESLLRIAPGHYTITVSDSTGRTATTTAEVRASDPPSVVTLPLPGAVR